MTSQEVLHPQVPHQQRVHFLSQEQQVLIKLRKGLSSYF